MRMRRKRRRRMGGNTTHEGVTRINGRRDGLLLGEAAACDGLVSAGRVLYSADRLRIEPGGGQYIPERNAAALIVLLPAQVSVYMLESRDVTG